MSEEFQDNYEVDINQAVAMSAEVREQLERTGVGEKAARGVLGAFAKKYGLDASAERVDWFIQPDVVYGEGDVGVRTYLRANGGEWVEGMFFARFIADEETGGKRLGVFSHFGHDYKALGLEKDEQAAIAGVIHGAAAKYGEGAWHDVWKQLDGNFYTYEPTEDELAAVTPEAESMFMGTSAESPKIAAATNIARNKLLDQYYDMVIQYSSASGSEEA